LVDAGNNAELEKRMLPRIAFGTAGLRGRMEAGFSGMNDLTVIQASQVRSLRRISIICRSCDLNLFVYSSHLLFSSLLLALSHSQGLCVYIKETNADTSPGIIVGMLLGKRFCCFHSHSHFVLC
jgi:hypothetical protein